MIELGKKQKLIVVKTVEFGIYLSSQAKDNENDKVLLPQKQVPIGTSIGDTVEVFVYRDSKDRMIATTNTPLLTLHEVGNLKVSQVGAIGAFLNWGLEKDLLLPFKEQTKKVKEGEECLVAVYTDKSSRLCATMNVYEYLKADSPYVAEDRVTGMVYQISEEFGAFVAVDNRYSGLVAKKEFYGTLQIGEQITARVVAVKPDGKLDLSIREKAYLQIEKDAEAIMKLLDAYNGVLPFTEKADPEVIKRELQMSKAEFKRALGNLLKHKKIEIVEKKIGSRLDTTQKL